MTNQELAKILNGIEYPIRQFPDGIQKQARDNRLVIVYGASDDLMEFDGAIHDELGAYDGTTAYVDSKGLIPDYESIEDDKDAMRKYFSREKDGIAIEAKWCPDDDGISWKYETSIPHETFNIMEDGNIYCVGIVFSLDELHGTELKK